MSQSVAPRWHELLSLARQHLESVGLTRSDWTWGGGTVLMLRHQHRLSWDIDLFLGDVQYLTYLSPRLNDAIGETVSRYTEQANHLRCFVEGVGEIDYLTAQPVIDVKPERMDVEGHGPIQVMSDREILAQKIQYRGTRFAGRDLFDFGTVTALRPELLKDEKLRQIGVISKSALRNRLETQDIREGFEAVQAHPKANVRISFEQATTTMRRWLAFEGIEPSQSHRPTPSSGPSM